MLDGLDVVFDHASAGSSSGEVRDSVGRLIVGLRQSLVGPYAAKQSPAGAGVIGSVMGSILEPILRRHGITLIISPSALDTIAAKFVSQIELDTQKKRHAISDEGRQLLVHGILDAAQELPNALRQTLKKEVDECLNLPENLAPTPGMGMGAKI